MKILCWLFGHKYIDDFGIPEFKNMCLREIKWHKGHGLSKEEQAEYDYYKNLPPTP